MDYNEYLTQIIYRLLKSGLNLTLAYIISQDGSSPKYIGTKMVIGADGINYGTIGGSSVEANTVKEAKAVLGVGQSKLLNFDFANDNAFSRKALWWAKDNVIGISEGYAEKW